MKPETSLLCYAIHPSDPFTYCTREKGHFGSHLSHETDLIWRQEEAENAETMRKRRAGQASRKRHKGKLFG